VNRPQNPPALTNVVDVQSVRPKKKSSLSWAGVTFAAFYIPAWLAGTKAEAEAATARRAKILFIMVIVGGSSAK
jgi:hypothetical protein